MTQAQRLGNRYQVGDLLGRGGMAEVHEGRDTRLGRRVAIKILRPDLARDPAFLARFRREAQSAAALNHPNIVAVYDTGEEILGEGPTATVVPFIVMELVEGITLKELLSSGNRLVPERALEITAGILAALDYSHRHGIVHRDIKPANVMLTTSGVVKVMDFGIARATSDTASGQTATSTVMGTAAYLSPEQAQGRTVDSRSDLYSTGVVLFELLTRRAPFLADSPVAVAFAHVNEGPPAPSSVDPSVPAALDPLVLKALAKDPAVRFQSAAEFRGDVERAIAGVPVTAVRPPVGVRGPADSAATTVLGPVDPGATAAHTPTPPGAPTGAMTMVPPGNPAATAIYGDGLVPPGTTGAPQQRKSAGAGRVIGLILLIVALAGGATYLALSLFNANNNPTVAVPDLSGMTKSEAESALTGVALKLGDDASKISDRPKNTVIAQNPLPGDRIEEGSSVDITLSAGKEQADVPDLVGLSSSADARIALEDVKLRLGKVSERDSGEPEGKVLDQSIKPNTSVDVGTSVNIVVSTAKVPVPNVVGQSQEQAVSDLRNQGFETQTLTSESDSTPGTVLAQSPRSGTKVKKGSLVTITVAKPRPVTPTPTQTPTPTPTPTETPTPTPEETDTAQAQPTAEPSSIEAAPDFDDNPGLSAEPAP